MLVRNAVAIADASAHLAYPPDLARMQDAPKWRNDPVRGGAQVAQAT